MALPIAFFLVCLPLRLGLVALSFWLSKNENKWPKLLFAATTLAISIGMFVTQYKRNQGEKMWIAEDPYWNMYAHGLFYLLFTLLFLANFKFAWVLLLLDVFYGTAVVIWHYRSANGPKA